MILWKWNRILIDKLSDRIKDNRILRNFVSDVDHHDSRMSRRGLMMDLVQTVFLKPVGFPHQSFYTVSVNRLFKFFLWNGEACPDDGRFFLYIGRCLIPWQGGHQEKQRVMMVSLSIFENMIDMIAAFELFTRPKMKIHSSPLYRLLQAEFTWYREFYTTFAPTAIDHSPAIFCSHPGSEPVRIPSFPYGWLKCPFHNSIFLIL